MTHQQNQQELVLDVKDMTAWVQDKLIKEHGIAVKAEDLELAFDLESEYLVEKGFAVPIDEEE